MLNTAVAEHSSEQVATIDTRGWQLLLQRGLTGEALDALEKEAAEQQRRRLEHGFLRSVKAPYYTRPL
ncbi:hypothetical protein [Pyruvatibacter mobilis]|uniref:hypothetical protein n=1 Tax=Pyruvatibacter mobilis TaxID=1712261 RepID=UPI003BADA3B9